MNLTSPVPHGAADTAGSSVTSLLQAVAGGGLFVGDNPDGWLGMAMSGLAGVATALAVALVLTVYFRSSYRSGRDIVRHGLAVTAVLGLLAFVISDMRHAAFAYLGINPSKPAVEFEIRLPGGAASAIGNTQIELHTDRNQTLAQVQAAPGSDENGRSIIRGSVPLKFRTSERVVILNLPGQASCEFKLRLAANPGRSGQFGPWHLVDRVILPNGGEETRSQQNDAFAIRYRVL